jgi:hypothetical protein
VQKDVSDRAYAAWALVCALGYLALQIVYMRHLPLVNDEFDGAYDVFRLRSEIPYVDFAPYKTVLGYYIQLPPLLLGSDAWSGMFNVKHSLAVLNTVLTLLAAWLARPLFSRLALALALPCWLFMSNWLERSSDLRVDTLTAWPGFFALVFLLRGRAVIAGLLCALSFLISQKGIYFIAGSGVALLAGLAVKQDKRGALADCLRFAIACAAPIALYFALFSLLASASKTTRVMFMSHNAIAFTEIYPNIRKFWRQTLTQNPGLYALAALGLVALLMRTVRGFLQRDASQAHARWTQLFAYCAVLTASFIWHKQPWPYFFVLLGPTAFVLCASAFDIIGRAATSRLGLAACWAVLAVPLVLSLAYPVLRVPVIVRESQAYQRHMLELACALVGEADKYLAGFDVLYDRTQSPRALRRLSIGLRRSLDHAPDEKIDAILEELRTHPPKVLVRNERFNGMPKRVKRYLQENYAPFWGNIELYAPRFSRRPSIELAFDGTYRVEIEGSGKQIKVDGRELVEGELIELARGTHALEAAPRGRLLWQPPAAIKKRLDARFQKRGELIGNAYNR